MLRLRLGNHCRIHLINDDVSGLTRKDDCSRIFEVGVFRIFDNDVFGIFDVGGVYFINDDIVGFFDERGVYLIDDDLFIGLLGTFGAFFFTAV